MSSVGLYVIPANISLGGGLVVCIFVGVCHGFQKLRWNVREQSRAVKLKVQDITLAVGIPEKLASYDLCATKNVLKRQAFASENLTKPQQRFDHLTFYGLFLPVSLFARLRGTEAGRSVPNVAWAGAIECKVGCLQSVEVCTRRLRDISCMLLAFARDVETTFPN